MAVGPFSSLSQSTGVPASAGPAGDAGNLRRRAVEFEALLLGNVLEKLEHSYGCVAKDSTDAAHDTQASLATQALSGALAKAGGIGIARMILRYLPQPPTEGAPESGTKSGASSPAAYSLKFSNAQPILDIEQDALSGTKDVRKAK